MTLIDVAIIATVVCALAVVSKQHRKLAQTPARNGFFAIYAGLILIALFYVADLATMYVAPLVATPSGAMDLMQDLHLNAHWLVALLGIGAISLGLVLAGRAMVRLIGDLEGREQQLADAQRIGRIGHWRVTPDTGEAEWSAEMYRIWGKNPADPAPSLEKILETIHPEDRDKVVEARDRAASANQPYELEFRIVLENGDVRHVRNEGRPEIDGQGHLRSIFGISQEITDRKGVENALRDSEERFRNLIEGSRQGVVIGSEDRKILFCNQAAADIYGYGEPKDIVALENSFDLIAHHDRDRLREIRESRFSGGKPPTVFEFEGLRKDGEVVHIQAVQRALSWDGQPAIQYAIIDITERRAAEEALNQAQKMEAVGQLTGGVAHDFNNLLAVIMGNLELLAARCRDDEKMTRFANQALAATERGAELTQRLLAFSRKQPLRPVVIDAAALVRGMRELLARSLGAEIEIGITGGHDLWPCEVDPGQLENAVLNLCINARDAMPRGGRLTIETSNITIKDDHAAGEADVAMGQFVLLAVSDTGEGMSEDVVAQAFNPFFTTKEVGKGSGLGLSMIYGFAKQSGGHARIYSEIGEGTTVKIYLPRSDNEDIAQADDRPKPITDTAARGETVLVVEDDADVRLVAVSFLTDLGYMVLEAGTAAEALEQIGRVGKIDLIDLIIADVILPGGMGGRELAEQACDLLPGLKVLFMSGYTEDAIMHHGRLDKGVELLVKPFGQGEFAMKIREILDK